MRRREKKKKANQASLLSVDSSHNSKAKETIEGKDRWVDVRVTMDSGAARHGMPETMFPRVKLERKTSPNKFVAATGEQIRDMGEKKIPLKTNQGNQMCMMFRSASVVKPLTTMQKKWSELEKLSCWMNRIRIFETFETERRSCWTRTTECTRWTV